VDGSQGGRHKDCWDDTAGHGKHRTPDHKDSSLWSYCSVFLQYVPARLISLLDLLCQKTKFVLHLQSLYKIL
jgi:hypothetical protein